MKILSFIKAKDITIVCLYMIFCFNSCSDPVSSDNSAKDIDGNNYKVIKIGNQIWMAENLKVTHFRNGDPIPNITSSDAWANRISSAYCSYNNDENQTETYGLLYNWFAVNDIRLIAPEGWHVPTDSEWVILEINLGMSQSETVKDMLRGNNEGGKLKATGNDWASPNTGATNSTKFSGLPGGYRSLSGKFYDYKGGAYFWTSSLSFRSNYYSPKIRALSYNSSKIYRYDEYKEDGYSIRCIKD